MLATCALLALTVSAAPYTFDPAVAEELRARDGVPNFLAKLRAGGPVRIAYLGGSITAAAGWRPKTLAWFKAQYPAADVHEINAAISGTGSDYSACRVQGDVLSKEPDLVFLECRVNGGDRFELQSVEGVVRQIWAHNPRTDICFVYTISEGMVNELAAGRQVEFGRVMERVADAYGIPSIDLGVEVAKRIHNGELVFTAKDNPGGKPVFAMDAAHPNGAGHDLYRDIIARSMLAMNDVGKPGDHVLIAPLAADCWQVATLLPITQVALSAGWQPVDAHKDAVYIDDRGRTDQMLRGAVKCDKAGETLTVKWTGTTIGLSDLPYNPTMEIEAVVDGGQPIEMKRVQYEAIHKYARFWYLPGLPYGPHTAVFTVKTVAEGQWFYAGQVLVVGTVDK